MIVEQSVLVDDGEAAGGSGVVGEPLATAASVVANSKQFAKRIFAIVVYKCSRQS